MQRRVPGRLWIGLVALALFSVIQLGVGLTQGKAELLIAVAINVALLIGLYLGHRWAYIALMSFSFLGVVVSASHNAVGGLIVLLLNGFVVVPVALCTGYFFNIGELGAPEKKADPLVCPSCGYSLLGLTDPRCPECGRQFEMPG